MSIASTISPFGCDGVQSLRDHWFAFGAKFKAIRAIDSFC